MQTCKLAWWRRSKDRRTEEREAKERSMALAIVRRGGWISRGALEARKCWKQRRGVTTLAYDEILVPNEASEDMHTVMFVHGLLGSGRNWRSFAKLLGTGALQQSPPSCSGYRMILVDLRNHGNSASLEFPPPHDIPAAAKDVAELIKAKSWGSPEIILSHSMGGKVALEFGRRSAAGEYEGVSPPKQLVVLDSVPGKVPASDSQLEVEEVLSTLHSLPDPIPSRRWLVDHLTKSGFSKSLAAWLGSNLKGVENSKEKMTWIFNQREANEMFKSYCNLDFWPMLESPPKGMEIGFVRASKSDRWTPEIISKFEKLSHSTTEKTTGKVSYHVLENAGHWLHVDNPSGLAEILQPYLVKLST